MDSKELAGAISMSSIPSDLKYTKTHEWVKTLPDGTVEVGITDHAQHALGACAAVESVKAASDVYSPLSGTVVARNEALSSTPELVNQEPYGAGWLMRLKPDNAAELTALLSAADYEALLAAEAL
jgi:glycine cleavage system H protein